MPGELVRAALVLICVFWQIGGELLLVCVLAGFGVGRILLVIPLDVKMSHLATPFPFPFFREGAKLKSSNLTQGLSRKRFYLAVMSSFNH